MSKEALCGNPFWQEVREGLFVHNKKWDTTIETLSQRVSAELVKHDLQSTNQLLNSGMTGVGQLGHEFITVTPNIAALETLLLPEGFYPLENFYLQWLFKYFILEAICNHQQNIPSSQWNPGLTQMVEEALHFMTYMAALICLYEEGQIKQAVTKDNFNSTQGLVQNKIKELTETLHSKAAEYGESFRRHGVQGTIFRLWDKIARYTQLSALGRDARYEPKADSARDLLGYCLIAWSLMQELE